MDSELKFGRRQSPEPGRPFVDRSRELGIVRERLSIGVSGDSIPSPVVCFWGTFGIGKSWLLGHLKNRVSVLEQWTQLSHPVITALLDLDRTVPAVWQDDQLDRVRLVRELWKQLASDPLLGAKVPNWEQASEYEWANAFVNQVTAWAARFATPMIMLDSVDDLVSHDHDAFSWLEQNVVERLAMTDRVLFIFTSRAELSNWERFQVLRRVFSHQLKAFDSSTAGHQIKASPNMSEALFCHAFGHPLITDYLGTELEKRGINISAVDGGIQIDISLVQAVLRGVMEEVLKDTPELAARLAKYASSLRWFDVDQLRFLSEGLDLVRPDLGNAYYTRLITDLQSHHLVHWNGVCKEYRFDQTLRWLLCHLTELEEPAKLCKAHQLAFRFYAAHLNEYPQYLARYLPELAYHRAILDRCNVAPSEFPAFESWWARFRDRNVSIDPASWAALVNELEQDTELRENLSDRTYRDILSSARGRIGSTDHQSEEVHNVTVG